MPRARASKHVQIALDLNDPLERSFGEMVARLPRQYFKMWVLKSVRAHLGAPTPEAMAQRLRDDLTGADDELSHGHQKYDSQSQPLSRKPRSDAMGAPAKSEPLSRAPASEPIHRNAYNGRCSTEL